MSVAGAVVDEVGRVLVCRRADNGHWEPPGGVLELDEDVLSGLRREVLEETGLEVEAERLTGVYKNMSRGIVALVFRCRVTGGSLGTSAEVVETAWLARQELPAAMDPAYAVRLLDALDDGAARVRAHDGVHLL